MAFARATHPAPGDLTGEQVATLSRWLRDKLPAGCPVCRHEQFQSPILVNSFPYSQAGTAIVGGQTAPLVLVFCGNCGHALQFSAVFVGLIPGLPPR